MNSNGKLWSRYGRNHKFMAHNHKSAIYRFFGKDNRFSGKTCALAVAEQKPGRARPPWRAVVGGRKAAPEAEGRDSSPLGTPTSSLAGECMDYAMSMMAFPVMFHALSFRMPTRTSALPGHLFACAIRNPNFFPNFFPRLSAEKPDRPAVGPYHFRPLPLNCDFSPGHSIFSQSP